MPPVTPEQRAADLAKASQVRTVRAELKAGLKAGTATLAEVITRGADDDLLGKIKVLPCCSPCPASARSGPTQIMERLGIAEGRRVRGLGHQQRAALEAEFAAASRNSPAPARRHDARGRRGDNIIGNTRTNDHQRGATMNGMGKHSPPARRLPSRTGTRPCSCRSPSRRSFRYARAAPCRHGRSPPSPTGGSTPRPPRAPSGAPRLARRHPRRPRQRRRVLRRSWRSCARHLPAPAGVQALVAVALESIAVYLAWQAHLAQLADDSAHAPPPRRVRDGRAHRRHELLPLLRRRTGGRRSPPSRSRCARRSPRGCGRSIPAASPGTR